MPNSHEPVYRAKGSASKQSCVDCGDKASDWSRIHGKQVGKPDSYVPRCKPCHRAYDREAMLEHLERVRPVWTPEQREHARQLLLARLPEMHAAQWTPEKREAKRQETIKRNRQPVSEETRRKMAEARRGKPSPNKGKKLSAEARARISVSLTGRKDSAETRRRKREAQLRRTDSRGW